MFHLLVTSEPGYILPAFLQYQVTQGAAITAQGIGHPGFGSFHLCLAAFPSQLSYYFIDLTGAGSANRMALGFQSTRGVYGYFAVNPGFTPLLRFTCRTELKEAQTLHGNNFSDGEAVMKFADIDVIGSKPGHIISLLG